MQSYKGYDPCFKWQRSPSSDYAEGGRVHLRAVHRMAVSKVAPSAFEFRAILRWTGCLGPPALTPEYGHLYLHMYMCSVCITHVRYTPCNTVHCRVMYIVLYTIRYDYGIFRSLFESAR